MDDAGRRPLSLLLLLAIACLTLVTSCATPYGGLRDPQPAPGVDQPAEAGSRGTHTMTHDGLERTWLTYVPAGLDEPAAVVLMFHGSGDDALGIRGWVGSYFERIADEHNVIIAYPNGHQFNWNECRREGRWPAKDNNVDDVGFARAIVDRLETDLGRGAIDRDRVFASGYSSGGHMAMRMGREADDLISGIAVVSANPPAPDNQTCRDQSSPMPALFITGVQDSVNPYEGGEVRVSGPGGSRGMVMSADAGAQWYADVNHASGPRPVASPASVRITDWTGDHPVRLVAVENEGHNFPLSTHHAPNEIWQFLDALSHGQ
ncbi:PHB depolymerase family esterase [Ammonicoccus fulvus]|uniref:PHB depolymerase family esterase n=1 Tax=Ammonicoccus fulvus TaxID=3138240 RepID=A0ABZ3FVF6_9ACTN